MGSSEPQSSGSSPASAKLQFYSSVFLFVLRQPPSVTRARPNLQSFLSLLRARTTGVNHHGWLFLSSEKTECNCWGCYSVGAVLAYMGSLPRTIYIRHSGTLL